MNSRFKALTAATAVSILCVACTEDVVFTGEETGSVPVMFSDVTTGDNLSLDLSMSVFFLHDEYAEYGGLSKEFYEGLSGRRIDVEAYANGSSEAIPFICVNDPSGASHTPVFDGEDMCFRYASPYVVQPSDKIEYKVSIDGYDDPLTATLEIPAAPVCEIESLDTAVADNCIRAVISIQDNASEENFYAFKAVLTYQDAYCYYYSDDGSTPINPTWTVEPDTVVSMVSVYFQQESFDIMDEISGDNDLCLSDRLFNGQKHNVKLEIGGFYNDSWHKVLPISMELRVLSQSAAKYYYRSSLDKLSNDLMSFMGESVQLYSNVKGGFGCVMGEASTGFEVDFR